MISKLRPCKNPGSILFRQNFNVTDYKVIKSLEFPCITIFCFPERATHRQCPPTMASPREMSSIEKSEGNHNVLKLDSLPVINCEVTKTAEEHPSITPVG